MNDEAKQEKYPSVEVYRQKTEELGMEYYQPNIKVQETPDRTLVWIDVGGHVFGKTIEEWHKLARKEEK